MTQVRANRQVGVHPPIIIPVQHIEEVPIARGAQEALITPLNRAEIEQSAYISLLFTTRKFDYTTTVYRFFHWAPDKITRIIEEDHALAIKVAGVFGYSCVTFVTTVLTPVAALSLFFDASDYAKHIGTPMEQQCLCNNCQFKEAELFHRIKRAARSLGNEDRIMQNIQRLTRSSPLRRSYNLRSRILEGSANYERRLQEQYQRRVAQGAMPLM